MKSFSPPLGSCKLQYQYSTAIWHVCVNFVYLLRGPSYIRHVYGTKLLYDNVAFILPYYWNLTLLHSGDMQVWTWACYTFVYFSTHFSTVEYCTASLVVPMCSVIKHLQHRRHVFEENVCGQHILSVQNVTECYNPYGSTMKKSVENQSKT